MTILAGLVYVNALRNPFVYDDYHTVQTNPSIQSVTNIRAIVLYDVKRPIVNFSYAVDRALWGTEPLGFHVTNVLFHMLNVLLLFRLASQLTQSDIAAGAGAALFAVHPMMTEAVGYISGRSEVLCATLLLLALSCGRRWIRGDGALWAAMTAGLWLASMATKEIGVMFPLVLFAYDWFVAAGDADGRRRRIFTVYLPLVLLAVAAGIVRLAILARIEHPGEVRIHWPYFLIALDVVRRYVGLMFYPVGQTIFHVVTPVDGVLDPRALLAFALLGAMVTLAWRARKNQGVVTVGILWFLLLLAPSAVLTVLDQGEPMAEHRVYAASAGLFLAAGSAIGWLSARLKRADRQLTWLAPAGLTLVVVSLCAETFLRNQVWSDPVTLWRESVDLAPRHFRPRLLLGEALQDAGRLDEAAEQFKTAIRLRPDEPTGYVKLGGFLAATGQLQGAREQFHEAIRVDPQNASARQALTVLDADDITLTSQPVGNDRGR